MSDEYADDFFERPMSAGFSADIRIGPRTPEQLSLFPDDDFGPRAAAKALLNPKA